MGDASETKLNGMNDLMDHNLAKVMVFLIDQLNEKRRILY